MRCPASTIIGIFAFASSLLAAEAGKSVAWKSTVVEVKPEPKAEIAEATFHFKNFGNQPVSIVRIVPACDCTTAVLAKTDYAPGEEGELKAKVKIAGQAGMLEKHLTVTTSDVPDMPVVLTIRITIPDLVEIEPRLLTWLSSDPVEAKQVEILFLTDPPLTLRSAKSLSPNFEVWVEPLTPNRQYRLFVKPKKMERTAPEAIVLEAQAGENQPMAVNVYAQIK